MALFVSGSKLYSSVSELMMFIPNKLCARGNVLPEKKKDFQNLKNAILGHSGGNMLS